MHKKIMAQQIECPVDFVTVNENKVRLTALFIFILSVIYLFIGTWIIPAFLVVDFFIRGFYNGRFSVLSWLSGLLVKLFSIPNKPVDRGAKKFAAQVGFLFSDMIFILTVINFTQTAFYIATVLVVFSFLESFVGFCAGCYVYTFYKKLMT